jgi:hypothetical protein
MLTFVIVSYADGLPVQAESPCHDYALQAYLLKLQAKPEKRVSFG